MMETPKRHQTWFQASQDPGSPYRSWYVWSDANPDAKYWHPGKAGFYYGFFSDKMPDLIASFLTNHDQNRVISQVGGKLERARSAAALLLTSPGVPFIYYGEEIGMSGIKQAGDKEIRTPMQWSTAANAGFTTGTPWQAVNADASRKIDVADQASDPNSLLSTYRVLIAARSLHAALRSEELVFVDTGNPAIYASLRSSKEENILVLINLSGSPVSDVHLTLAKGPLSGSYQLASILGTGPFESLQANPQGGFDSYQPVKTLPAYSALILQLQAKK